MRIRPIDLADTEEFATWHAIDREAELFERPDSPSWSEQELWVLFTTDDGIEKLTAYGAFDADVMVAAGFIGLRQLDNVDKAFVHVAVPPSLRRRGIGTALLDHLVGLSVEAGRGVVLAESWLPPGRRETHPYRMFAEKHGFALANVEIRRELRLPLPTEQLDEWAAEAAEHHRGYRIVTFVDDLPDELLPSYCYVKNQLALDAPTGDIELEAGAMTPELVVQRQAIAKQQGRTTFHALAVDATGEAVAYTSMAVPEHEPDYIHQWGTLVRRDHRGHRLGLAVKVANIAVAQAAFPDRTRLNTQNAETNGPMVAINERLGFRPVDELAEFQRIVTVGGDG